MAILISFLVVEIIVLALVLPVKITIKCNLSSVEEKGIIIAKIFDFLPIKTKVEKSKEQFRISVNGKEIKINEGEKEVEEDIEKSVKIDLPWFDLIRRCYAPIESVEIMGVVGGKDAFQTAMNNALFTAILSTMKTKLKRCFIVPDFQSNRFVFDGKITIRISAFDILEMVRIYGNKRNFATNH
mgnify:CR=1 FL=1